MGSFGDTEADAGCRWEVGINRGQKHQRAVLGTSGSETLQDVGASEMQIQSFISCGNYICI